MEELLRSARLCFEPLPIPVLLVEPGEGGWRVLYRNPAAGTILREGEEPELLAAASEAIRDRVTLWQGRFRDRELSAEMTYYEQGPVLLGLRDETEERRRQREQIDASKAALQSALDAANAANKAKSDFLSNMSHDIRTPLNAIVGMTTIAQAHLEERERVEDCLDKIGLSSRHLLGLINDILDMSRIESGKMTLSPEDFTMADFIHALMAVFRPQADKKRQRVELDFSGIRHEQVRGDQLRIQQIMINILSNAVKFTPEEGTISLSVRETGSVGKDGRTYGYYEFVVRDTGIGMSREFLGRMFQPFERDASVHRIEGTGLGMTITQNLVKMMNGEIAVESEPGKGSRFTVTLPLEQLPEAGGDYRELRGLRVLAAESDETALRNLREILADLGMECDVCSNAWDAMDMAAQAHIENRDYFAILLAWHLPGVDGVRACRELRQALGRDVPILVMSAFEWTMTADEMRKNGISGFVPKPLFRTRVSEALYVYTPAGRAAADRGREKEEQTFPDARVLLVEDNEINREIGMELIGMLGAQVEAVEDGKQALERVRDGQPGDFDLIFMDIQMPVMDGYQATRAIRALPRPDCRTIPIVAMSANAFVEDIRACERAGMNAHVPKPVSPDAIADVMARFLKK